MASNGCSSNLLLLLLQSNKRCCPIVGSFFNLFSLFLYFFVSKLAHCANSSYICIIQNGKRYNINQQLNSNKMTTFNFNNQPTATVSKEIIFHLFAQLDLTWHGMNEFGRYEQELIEDELNVGIEIKLKSDVKRTAKNLDNIDNYEVIFHDNNFDWDAEEEEIIFDNETKELTIEETVFTLQSFDNGNFARLVEQHTKEFTNSFFYGIGELPKGSKKFKSGLLNGISERVSFVKNSAENRIFKGRELKILKAIQKGKKLCIH